MITTISLININHLTLFFLLIRIFKIYFLANFSNMQYSGK